MDQTLMSAVISCSIDFTNMADGYWVVYKIRGK